MQTTDAINRVNALTQEQRDAAYAVARERIAGRKPQATAPPELAQFLAQANTHYPAWVTTLVRGLTVFTLVVVFLPSAMRLHAVALTTNNAIASLSANSASVYVAALATVIMAEIGQTIMSLASAVTQSRTQKLALWFGALVCTGIALSGNALAMQDHALDNAFSFLETFAPPLLVLILAQIIKTQMMDAIALRYEAGIAYRNAYATWERDTQYAMQAWDAAYNGANANEDWPVVLANALRDALRNANKQSKAVLRELTAQDWRALVLRERNASEWWREVEAEVREDAKRIAAEEAKLQVILRKAQPESGKSTGATGEVASATTLRDGDTWVKVCPECAMRFEGASKRQATMRLVAHMKAHRNAERKQGVEEDTQPVEVA